MPSKYIQIWYGGFIQTTDQSDIQHELWQSSELNKDKVEVSYNLQ